MADKDNTWCTLYPVYLDKAHSLNNGRRIASQFALDSPTTAELSRALQTMNIPNAIEADKRHPSTPRTTGRVRFLIKDETGELINSDIDCKQTLLMMIAEKITQERKEKALTAPKPTAAKGKKGGK